MNLNKDWRDLPVIQIIIVLFILTMIAIYFLQK
jgi:hypothetical protein